jgi:SAM-dependent methyltransferase
MVNQSKEPIKSDWENFWKEKKLKVSINKKRIMKILDRYVYKKIVFDAGCGSGFFSKYFIERDCKVISIDYSKEALKLTGKLNNRIIRVRANMFDMPFKEKSFDFIFSDGLLEHYRNPIKILLEFKKLLKPGGIIATFVPNKISYWILFKYHIMKDIVEYRFTLNKLIKMHESIGLKTIEFGGLGVIPSRYSPELLGKYIGRIIYTIAKKS